MVQPRPAAPTVKCVGCKVQASGIDKLEDKDILPVLIKTLQKMQGADGSWNNPHVDLYCKQIARRNFSLSQLELIEQGHTSARVKI
jgi:hypothetical protein